MFPQGTSSEDAWTPQDLLNFQYAPLRSFHQQVLPSPGRHGVKYKRSATYNKEAFLQAKLVETNVFKEIFLNELSLNSLKIQEEVCKMEQFCEVPCCLTCNFNIEIFYCK